jgi:diacylglycerol kinase family enzyme
MKSEITMTRRVAALVALVGAAVLVVVVVVFLVRSGVLLLFGLAGLAVTVAGAWWAVTERMPRRLVGIIAGAVGFVVMCIALALAASNGEHFLLNGAIVVVLLAVSLGCGRAAVVHGVHRLEPAVRADGPPRRPVLFCNPISGGGKVVRFGLVELAAQLGVETVMLQPGLDLEQLARDAVARGADCLGMAGGDGSQALVASIAVEHNLPFVCISAGTRNHFALDLALDREDPRKGMYAFRDAIERRVDYATVNGRLFVNNVSLGVYAEVVQQESYRDAKLETTKNLLPDLLNKRSEPFDLQFTTPDGHEVEGAIVVMVSNNPYVVFTVDNAQRRRLDTGLLGVGAVTTSTGSEAARLLTAIALGQRQRSQFWHEFTATSFEVRSRSGTAYAGIDGEALELTTPLRFEIHPSGLTLLVPEDNIEAATRRRARDVGIGDLIGIAAGHELELD